MIGNAGSGVDSLKAYEWIGNKAKFTKSSKKFVKILIYNKVLSSVCKIVSGFDIFSKCHTIWYN